MPRNYAKTFAELKAVAAKFWPAEFSALESDLSIIPLLLQTQDQFIHILSATSSLENLFRFVELTSLPANLFVKHLVIWADFGGEMWQRISAEFNALFPSGELHYFWQGEPRIYQFAALPSQKFSNKALKIDGQELLVAHPLNALQKDAIALLLFGSAYRDGISAAAALAKCVIGEYLGKNDELATFIKQRYIWVSQC